MRPKIAITHLLFQLGVNGYSYIVNNNGHVLYHPNLRPVVGHNTIQLTKFKLCVYLWLQYSNKEYEETLQPTYISVDLSELELIENENGPRENHSVLLDVSLVRARHVGSTKLFSNKFLAKT